MSEEKEASDPVLPVEEASESNDASEKDDRKDTGFTWQDYLEVTNSQEVPHPFFQHVEAGLDTELENGMILEVPRKDDPSLYWLAKVVLACGPFSRLRYSGDVEDQTADFWCDLTNSNAQPIGWCDQEGKVLTPPESIAKLIGDVQSHIEEVKKTAKPVPPHLLSGEGFVPTERIKAGMKVEVQDVVNPYSLWIATIIENVGGRLLLRYDTPDSSSPEFWLYFTSSRIYPMGWCSEKGDPWVLRRPAHFQSCHGKEEWEAVIEMAKEDARRTPLPTDFFKHSDEILPHSFMMGMKVEALHPIDRTQIFPATVMEVWGDAYFLVELDFKISSHGEEEPRLTWLCTSNHPYIFPTGWANKHGIKISKPIGWKDNVEDEFHWDEYLQQTSAVAAPEKCFPQKPCAKYNGILAHMKLEAANPLDQSEICVSTVGRTTGHIVWIHLERNESDHPRHAVSYDSTDIFPVGWCDSNSYPLKPPLYYQMPSSSSNSVLGDESNDKKDTDSGQRMSKLWCPKIYFNHRCFSGPFLSKCKLAGLPQAVGPGPVRLVMREVLSMLISVAYKSSRVLKEIQCDGDLKPGEHVEVLKAKFNQTNYRARVAVVNSSDQVAEFCQDICLRLKVCPYLFGPTRVEAGRCPEKCNISKTKFTSQYWSNRQKKSNRPAGDPLPELEIVGPKKRRGRKRRFSSIKTRNSAPNANSIQGAESDASGDDAVEPSSQSSVPESTPRRREIVTRGAKQALNSSTNAPATRQRPERRGVKRQRETESTDQKSPNKVEFPAPGSWLYPLPKVDSNPRDWTVDDVEAYLNQTKDCKSISKLLKKEAFDGVSFMLLNLPTAVKQLNLKPLQAVNLCRHVAQIKYIFFKRFVYDME
ncbi:scm-like with four MBT domains protein 1 isoform X1 [Thrips palmi]|uniref:Scm-like with four MBT domains protein 1 isoform X1 n=1 Tax=Thrips palmi TaxID=161013 RepID=A0A6P8ZKG0_THRPL|nr:scm-like with four MBT domains protein 1 isoform X1 [Thrips palmi]